MFWEGVFVDCVTRQCASIFNAWNKGVLRSLLFILRAKDFPDLTFVCSYHERGCKSLRLKHAKHWTSFWLLLVMSPKANGSGGPGGTGHRNRGHLPGQRTLKTSGNRRWARTVQTCKRTAARTAVRAHSTPTRAATPRSQTKPAPRYCTILCKL